MSSTRINFNNLNDGVDWANALPPHIMEQMRQERMMAHRLEDEQRRLMSRPMFVCWPIAEESFPVPPSVLRRRELRTLSAVDRVPTNPMRLPPQPRHSTERQSPVALDDLVSVHLRAMNEMAEQVFGAHLGATSLAATVPHAAAMRQLFATEARAPTTSRETVTIHGSPHGPAMTITHIEERWNGGGGNTRRVNRVRRHINSSGVDFDIITGGARGTRAAFDTNDSEWELSDMSYERLLELDLGNEPSGLHQRQLRGMKVQQHKGPSVTCSICLEDVKQGAKTLDIGCEHKFHHRCIVRWLAQRNCCPACRREIPRLQDTR